ncbi:MAG: hypothetical protein DPW15_12795 [Chloroflexi bacterium]|nr:hypothetical protein [Chloroflexota bacterium]
MRFSNIRARRLAFTMDAMNDNLRVLQFLLARLERIPADSVVAHRASGVRGALLRALDQLEAGRPVPVPEMRRLIESGYRLLEKAAREKIRSIQKT